MNLLCIDTFITSEQNSWKNSYSFNEVIMQNMRCQIAIINNPIINRKKSGLELTHQKKIDL